MHFLGATLAMVAMGSVLYYFGSDLRLLNLADPVLLPRMAVAVALYTSVVFLGAIAWGLLLKAFGGTPERWVAERHLLISQLAKYLPGNVAHYAGRVSLAVSVGIPAGLVGIAILTETASIIIGAVIVAALSLVAAPSVTAPIIEYLPNFSVFVWVWTAFLILPFIIILRKAAPKYWSKLSIGTVRWVPLLAAVALYTIALLLLGWSFQIIAVAIAPVPLSEAVAVFAVAWVAGLATPGSPGGLGVRESVIAIGLAPTMGGAAALSAALLHRGASVLGDVMSFGIGLLLPGAENSKRANRCL